jgi:hypothetical protein
MEQPDTRARYFDGASDSNPASSIVSFLYEALSVTNKEP